MSSDIERWLGLDGQVAVVTGGTGVLGSAMAAGLAAAGARVAVLARRAPEAAEDRLALTADVLRREELIAARERVLEHWGRVDVLVNAAGGNTPGATLEPGESVFELPEEAIAERQLISATQRANEFFARPERPIRVVPPQPVSVSHPSEPVSVSQYPYPMPLPPAATADVPLLQGT